MNKKHLTIVFFSLITFMIASTSQASLIGAEFKIGHLYPSFLALVDSQWDLPPEIRTVDDNVEFEYPGWYTVDFFDDGFTVEIIGDKPDRPGPGYEGFNFFGLSDNEGRSFVDAVVVENTNEWWNPGPIGTYAFPNAMDIGLGDWTTPSIGDVLTISLAPGDDGSGNGAGNDGGSGNGTGNDGGSGNSGGGVAPVPEPSTMLLIGAGLIGIAGYGRRKKR